MIVLTDLGNWSDTAVITPMITGKSSLYLLCPQVDD